MRIIRKSQRSAIEESSQPKRQKNIITDDYFSKTLEECGLQLRDSADKCVALHEPIVIIRNLKNKLQQHIDYPHNVAEFYANFQKRCNDMIDFKHYLFPNIVRKTDGSECSLVSYSVVKILLSVPILQNRLMDFILEKAIDLAAANECGQWIQMILKCYSSLDNLVDSDKISEHLINLLAVSKEHLVRLEIITAIPDIIGDQAHENIAAEMSKILSEDHELIPAILDCLSYLCLSDEQYNKLQKNTLNILMTIPKWDNLPNFVKFLLIPGRTTDTHYLEVVQGLKNALNWSTSIIDKPEQIVTSQVLTATAIRNSIVSCKVIANAWLKAASIYNHNMDHKPIDFVIMLILYSTSEERQKQLETLIHKQIKSNILNEELLNDAFEKFKPILKDYLQHLISLTNSLLEVKSEPVIQNFASHLYTLMFSQLEEFGQTIVAELLQLGLDSRQCAENILSILNKVASKDMSILKPQSVQMLKLLDRIDDMTLPEVRAMMNFLCRLAYGDENSVIRDDIHMIIRKELGSSNPTVKIQGILAGIHAVKYLMASKDGKDLSIDLSDDIGHLSMNHLIEGDLREAAHIIESISHNTRQLPDITAFFYDELCKVIQSSSYINKYFLHWMTDAVTNDLEQNFIVNNLEHNTIEDLKLDIQYCLNSDSEVDEVIAINIAGRRLQAKENVNIQILSPLFQLVQTLHLRKYNGDLSKIDALLGCPVVMPIFDVDSIEDMSSNTICHILDCLIHCANWFREIVNAFASQTDLVLKTKILSRVSHIRKIENLISTILLKINFIYKPPANIAKSLKNNENIAINNAINKKKVTNKETVLPDTLKLQTSVSNTKIVIKKRLGHIQNITFRPFSHNILNLLKDNLTDNAEEETGLNIEELPFLLKCINCSLENVLISRFKKKTFLTKQDSTETYDSTKAEEYAQSVNVVVPKIINHIHFITSHLDKSSVMDDNEEVLMSNENSDHVLSLEYIFNMFTTYFKWIGFKIHHKPLLETSLRSIAGIENNHTYFLPKLLVTVAEYFQKHQKYCVQLTTAVSLLEVVSALQEHTATALHCSNVTKISRKMAQYFLSRDWKSASGAAEKRILFNHSLDQIIQLNLKQIEISELKSIVLLLINDVETLKTRTGTLNSFPSINKSNVDILYRNLGCALQESAQTFLNKGLTNLQLLVLWKDVMFILKCMSDMAKALKVRNILIAFYKKSLPIIRLFVQLGIPLIELEFKKRTKDIQELLATLQQSTRFLQILGRHFRAKKDKALLAKVPYMKQLLETLLYKVKAVLVANNCSEAFWMGTLKNKNIDGEVIATQQSVESEDSTDNGDEQLPYDDSDDTDNEILNSDSRSSSVIV